ncbi:hypothetical protein SLS63_011429 [Diaporthe eres]|uniref:Uncharacterized protein n=1 Tax=Diaporthe eres TaxID=83184 RepID=A0ABR1NUA1_DIAER
MDVQMDAKSSICGTFTVEIFHSPTTTSSSVSAPQPGSGAGAGGISPARTVLWDRKADGGFPETKELKRRVRDVIEPGRDLGHVDRNHARPATAGEAKEAGAGGQQQQGAGQAQVQQDKPSRSELEAAGPAGAGYPGASEAAATQLAGQAGPACENKAECEDCD